MKRIIVFITCLLGALSTAIAQPKKDSLLFSFEQDTILAEPGSTLLNFLLIKNESNRPIEITKIAAQTSYPGTLLKPSSAAFTLSTGEGKRFPVKFLANQEFLKIPDKSVHYSINYVINGNDRIQTTSFYIDRKEDNSVSIYPFATENYLDPNLPESKVSFFIENRSYSARQIKLSYRVQPEGLQISRKEEIISLEAKEKRLIDLQVSTRSSNSFNPDYQLLINAEDMALNKIIGSTNIRVIILSNSRQMNASGSDMSDNSIELTHAQLNRGSTYDQLRANGLFALGRLQAGFSTNVDYYAQQQNLNIYNSWFELGSDAMTLRLGNIYGEDYDYSISGKGAKLTYQPNDHHSFEALASENDYSLYNSIKNSRELARTFATRYQFMNNGNKKAGIAYVYNTDPNTSINTNLLTLSSAIAIDSIQNLRFDGGVSNQENISANLSAIGYSAGVYYGLSGKKLQINSNNSYSTPKYAGQRRGSLNINQSFSYRVSQNKQIFLRYTNTINQPRYLTTFFDTNGNSLPEIHYYGRSQIFGTGFSLNHPSFDFSVSPQITEQKNNTNNLNQKLLSYSLKMDISTHLGTHSLNFSTEYGSSSIDDGKNWYKNLRLLLSYRYNKISLNALASFNPQNIYEVIQSTESKNKVNNYSLYSSYSFTAFNQKLKTNLSGGINYSNTYGNFNKNLNANIEYKLANTWSLTGSGSYSGFKSETFSSNNSQYRFGIKKYFRQATSVGNHNVKLKLFQDDNYNGIMDAKEKAISGKIIRLNNSVALTNKDGEVNYQNVMPGTYRLSINNQEGLQLKGVDSVLVNRNRTLLLPMIQNIRISGELKEIRQQYDTKEADITGINVYAKNEKGEIFNTFVNPQGGFDFYLIEGNYTVYFENTRYEFLNPSQSAQAIKGETSKKLIFEFKKKGTEIKVKKF
ncbi:hypothetical protein [Albibacterium sp.]|uniref:hypothetical protein n=1 Tax=Albibacterium sp. TaxID=2952885 RepID=UPI002BC8442D|nr:hypothetical protein [Albibacterium sp.]HUH18722.1 hypothetical protein [Albibacterium sp.]